MNPITNLNLNQNTYQSAKKIVENNEIYIRKLFNVYYETPITIDYAKDVKDWNFLVKFLRNVYRILLENKIYPSVNYDYFNTLKDHGNFELALKNPQFCEYVVNHKNIINKYVNYVILLNKLKTKAGKIVSENLKFMSSLYDLCNLYFSEVKLTGRDYAEDEKKWLHLQITMDNLGFLLMNNPVIKTYWDAEETDMLLKNPFFCQFIVKNERVIQDFAAFKNIHDNQTSVERNKLQKETLEIKASAKKIMDDNVDFFRKLSKIVFGLPYMKAVHDEKYLHIRDAIRDILSSYYYPVPEKICIFDFCYDKEMKRVRRKDEDHLHYLSLALVNKQFCQFIIDNKEEITRFSEVEKERTNIINLLKKGLFPSASDITVTADVMENSNIKP